MSKLRIENVTKRFEEVVAVDALSLDIEEGEAVVLLGPSGCGKTTLLKLIAGFHFPNTGRIILDDKVLSTPHDVVTPDKRHMGMVFQSYAIWPHKNVFDNVAFGLRIRKESKDVVRRKVKNALAMVHMEGLEERYATELSGGQQQRVALARALVVEPSVLLLDEPLSNLDASLREEMREEIRDLKDNIGITCVYVTHDQTEAMVMSDRIAVMNQGRIVQEGTAREIYMRPASVFASDFIGDTNLISGVVADADDGRVRVQGPGGVMLVGEASEALAPGTTATLSVRPEALRLRPGGPAPGSEADGVDGDWSLSGTIMDIIYLGNRVRFEIAAGDDLILLADLRDEDSTALARGTTVTVTWAPSAALVWAGDEGAADDRTQRGRRA